MFRKPRLLGAAALLILTLTSLPQCTPASKGQDKAAPASGKTSKVQSLLPLILTDHLRWNKASPAEQDKAIAEVAKVLGSDYVFVETKTYECAGIKHRIATFKHFKADLLLNLIPGGTYLMGSNEKPQEQPIHKVTVQAMLVGKHEVTQAQWQKFMKVNRAKFKGPNKPIDNISVQECESWLAAAGGQLRLPSESEWEYICRAGSTTKYFWGDTMNSDYCWFNGDAGNYHAVTEHAGKSNAFGLVDTSGNVTELCRDGWTQNYKKAPNDSSSQWGERFARITRGGGIGMSENFSRSSYRHSTVARSVYNNTGFRVFRSLD